MQIKDKKPKRSSNKDRQADLFRVELSWIFDYGHDLAMSPQVVAWDQLDERFGSIFRINNGRHGVSTRLTAPLHYLKYTYNLSDEEVMTGRGENPYR